MKEMFKEQCCRQKQQDQFKGHYEEMARKEQTRITRCYEHLLMVEKQ